MYTLYDCNLYCLYYQNKRFYLSNILSSGIHSIIAIYCAYLSYQNNYFSLWQPLKVYLKSLSKPLARKITIYFRVDPFIHSVTLFWFSWIWTGSAFCLGQKTMVFTNFLFLLTFVAYIVYKPPTSNLRLK